MLIDLVMHPKFALYLDYWHSLKGAHAPPDLVALLDHPIPDIQPWLVIVDVGDDSFQRIRLVGTGIVDFFGVETTGMNFLGALSKETAPVFLRCHQEVPRIPCGKFHESICSTSLGREIDVGAMALPIRRGDSGSSVVWLLDPGETLSFGEHGSEVRRVVGERWIDLGYGIPS